MKKLIFNLRFNRDVLTFIIIFLLAIFGVSAFLFFNIFPLQERTKNKTEPTDWIWGGSKTSMVGVKLSDQIVRPSETFSVWVQAWTFSTLGSGNYTFSFRLFRSDSPSTPLAEKTLYVHKNETSMYAIVSPFGWAVVAPAELGNFTYRVVMARENPTYTNYSAMVEFSILVREDC
jgi:hypothetical protein